jgi:EmrB/QacA subfamily drug resistance transporter
LIATILASSLAFVDGSVVNVGLHAVGKTFNANAADLQWVVNAYLLPLSSLLLLGGAAGDRFGRVRLLVIGTALFILASTLCAFAPSLFWLLAGRAVQGCGAALLLPNSLAILGANFYGGSRGRAIGIWASAGAAVAAIGPILGGWLIDTVGWRAIFLINLPLGVGAILLTAWFVEEAARESKAPTMDLLGGMLATIALLALTWGLTVATSPEGWTVAAQVTVSSAVVLLAWFLLVEKMKGDTAMMPLSLFTSRDFIGLTLLTFLLYGALGVLLVLLPFLLIEAESYSSTEAGTALLPFAVVLALASPMMGRIAGQIGPRLPLTIGPLVVAGGFLLLLRMAPDSSYWRTVLPAILVISIGMAGAVAPLTTAVLGSVDSQHTGSASGLNSAVARTGGLMGTALLGGILGATGPELFDKCQAAWIACAVTCVIAAACSFFLISIGAPDRPGQDEARSH